jgi:hypothetical protein
MLNAAEITANTATVAASMDQSLPLYRRSVTKDSYGNDVEGYPGSPTLQLACNIYKPSATTLTTYAGVIGGRRALMLRYMSTNDVREGDRVVYQSLNWRVQPLETAASYQFANDVLIVVIT